MSIFKKSQSMKFENRVIYKNISIHNIWKEMKTGWKLKVFHKWRQG